MGRQKLVIYATAPGDRGQVEALQALGCQIVQGYFISRPVPVDEVIGLLKCDWLRKLGAISA